MQKSPAISLVMAIYNSARYLPESMESIFNQTFTDYEIIIADDGSTDDGPQLIDSYGSEKIRMLRCPHNFIASLNIAMQAARGKYIARMDADDIMLPRRLEIQFDFMESHPQIDVCGSWSEWFGANEGTIQCLSDHIDIVTTMLLGNPLSNPTTLLRRASVARRIEQGIYHSGYAFLEDYRLWSQLAMEGRRFANISEVLLKYRCSATQASIVHQREVSRKAQVIREEYGKFIFEEIIRRAPEYESSLRESIRLFRENKIDTGSLQSLLYYTFRHVLNKTGDNIPYQASGKS